ncbi:MAG: M36 family metallopeptidase [Thermoleophilaceae bacterium]|nr:M36 family metallopeptidase [Thermoleophilaceae bacterium]
MRSDPLTGGLRLLAKRDGFLTGPRAASPRRVALDYLGQRADAFGLDEDDLAAFELSHGYTSESGATHLQWQQTYRGIPAFDEGLRANVAADGQLINIGGAPRPDLAVASTVPRIGAREALHTVARSAFARVPLGPAGPSRGPQRATRFDRGHRASLVLFGDPSRVRLGWRVLLWAGTEGVLDAVVDAGTGELLYRNDLTRNAAALAFDNHPGAPQGGVQTPKDFSAAWLSDPGRLIGPNAWVHSDPNDTHFEGTLPTATDEIPPTGGAWNYVQAPQAGLICPAVGCSWAATSGGSWMTNRRQAGTQLFYFVNLFHDHLRDAPGIGFGASSGSFEGSDPLYAQIDDGAGTGMGSLPDCSSVNNASMIVLPDGTPGLMETFLWTSGCGAAGVYDVNGADDASIVYHEYTHGLSLRLVTDPAGYGALNGPQSAAMGEGISDWYALDFLEAFGFQPDTSAPAEIRAAVYENAAARTQGFDCPVGESTGACPGTPTAGSGGYTYGDFGRILGSPEVHADGEIWVETLWDLRRALIGAHGASDGINRVRALITDGLRLSPAGPTFLDMRNAIVQADVNRGFGDRDLIWAVFAARGMGVNARTSADNDTHPVEDFTAPPPLPGPPPPGDETAPVISGFTMTAKRFRVGLDRTPQAAAKRRRRTPVGSEFRFRLSERAKVVITIERALPGQKVGRSCRPPSRRLRGRVRCTRYKKQGSITRSKRPAGRNAIDFSGRIGIRPLPRGRHRVTVSATDAAGNRSKRRRISFTIVRK